MYKTIGKTLTINYINIHNYQYYNHVVVYNLHAYANIDLILVDIAWM